MEFRITNAPRNAKRVQLVVNNEPVSGLYLFDLPMRIGQVVVRMGGIGGVATPEKHRMKGYCRLVMQHAVEYMASRGYDVSLLFGIPNLYHKWGFIECLAEQECTIKVSGDGCPGALAEVRADCTLRRMKRDDVPRVLDIYHTNSALRSGALVRDPAKWRKPRKGSRFGVKARAMVAERDGQVVGYMFLDEVQEAVVCAEALATDSTVYPSFAAYLARQAKQIGAETVRVLAPVDDPFAVYLRRFGTVVKLNYPLCRGAMARIISFDSLMKKLVPEFTRRANAAVLTRSAYLGIATELGEAVVSYDGRRARVEVGRSPAPTTLRVTQDVLMQMLLGYRGWDDAVNDERVSVAGRPSPLGPALFPQSNPYMWAADHF